MNVANVRSAFIVILLAGGFMRKSLLRGQETPEEQPQDYWFLCGEKVEERSTSTIFLVWTGPFSGLDTALDQI
jgi:hypothetical protein